ncbi:MAG: glucose 1-dehydrogenase [Fimbriimonadaceae bacterium]|nr:glucose 1-dehydrogenase [Alphaproteobacteria bacterium]
MARLNGKTALITGGGGGIGRTLGSMFAAEGATVMLSDIDGDAAANAARSICASHPGAAFSCAHDVTSEAQWRDAVAACETDLGGLNILVNNAGLCIPGTVEEMEPEVWHRMIGVNLDSVYLGCRTSLAALRKSAPSSIINISSISGLIAGHNLAAYNAAKSAVWLLTKSVALQAARERTNIRVNSIHPAFIETKMLTDVAGVDDGGGLSDRQREKFIGQIPLKRFGTTADVGYAAIYLASDESGFMTGSEIKLDGGISAM